jgi:signal transduction histidine kinase
MTSTISATSARAPHARAASHAPGGGRPREAKAWQLVSDASHELRTPLTALRTEVDLALLGDRDVAELRAALSSAAGEIRRLCRLADDILILAQSDHGRLPMRPRPLVPREVLEAAAARARAAAWTQGRQIVVGDLAAGTRLLGDPDRAAQALDNLVSNALQYGCGTITLTARDDGELVALHVADQGNGFAPDMAEHAFRRFSRGKRSREPGSGLGLSLVAAIARAHRGVATVCNPPQGGADACLALPRWCPTETRSAATPGCTGTESTTTAGSRPGPSPCCPRRSGLTRRLAIERKSRACRCVCRNSVRWSCSAVSQPATSQSRP